MRFSRQEYWSGVPLPSQVNKASGCNKISEELFKFLMEDAIKVLHSLCQQIWKTQQWPHDWKRSVLILIPKKGSTKECANHQTIILISHTRKVMLQILQAKLQHYATKNFQMSKLGLEKEEELKIKLSTFTELKRKQGNLRKHLSLFHRLH